MRRTATLLALAMLSLTPLACGGGDGGGDASEQEQARQVTTDAIAAIREHDFETFWDQIRDLTVHLPPGLVGDPTGPASHELRRPALLAGADRRA